MRSSHHVAPAIQLEQLFIAHYAPLLRYVRRRCGCDDTSADIVAETFTAATPLVMRGDQITVGWLTTVANRRLVDHWRKVYRLKSLDATVSLVRPVAVEDEYSILSDFHALRGRLPARQLAALQLRYNEGNSVGDVAELLGLSYSATESLLARARRAAASVLDEQSDLGLTSH